MYTSLQVLLEAELFQLLSAFLILQVHLIEWSQKNAEKKHGEIQGWMNFAPNVDACLGWDQ